jgi:hypothetical protein
MPAQLEGVKGKNKKKELKISLMGEVTKKQRKEVRSQPTRITRCLERRVFLLLRFVGWDVRRGFQRIL